jgi:hypothetical protein
VFRDANMKLISIDHIKTNNSVQFLIQLRFMLQNMNRNIGSLERYEECGGDENGNLPF